MPGGGEQSSKVGLQMNMALGTLCLDILQHLKRLSCAVPCANGEPTSCLAPLSLHRGQRHADVVKSNFVVPPCRGRRELVTVVDSGAGFTVTRLRAYQVTNLVPGTKYYISYLVKKGTSTEYSKEIPMSTLPRRKMESIGLGMARTGGMVVITVLLSIAMFLLVVGFIITLVLDAQK
ncbi:uroplakin-2 [Dugong dugon]